MSNRALAALASVIVTACLSLGHVAGQAAQESPQMEQVSNVFDGSFSGTTPAGN